MALEKLLVRLVGDGTAFRQMLDDATTQTDKFANSAGKKLIGFGESGVKAVNSIGKAVENIGDKVNKLGRGIARTGKRVTLGLTVPIGAAVGVAAKSAVDLNRAMANIASLGVGGDRLLEMRKAIQSLSIDVNKSTTDLAEGMYDVISAFEDTDDAIRVLEITSKAATAGLSTTREAIKLTSAVTKGYGDTSADAVQKASDLAFTAVRLGQTTFPELAASIGKVTPLTKGLGVSQEELFAVMATLTGVTGGAAEVSTQLRGVMQSLMSPTDATTKLLKGLGIESGKQLIEQQGLAGALKTIADEANRTGQPLSKFISSIEGQTAALALTGAQAGDYSKKLGEMNEATGATDEAFKAQTDGINNLEFMWGQLQKRVIVLAQNIGFVLIPIFLDLTKKIEPIIEKFTSMDKKSQKLILIFGGVAAALGPLIIVLGNVVSAVGPLIGILGKLIPIIASAGSSVLAFTNPVTAVIAVVIGAIAALRFFAGSWENAGKIAENAADLMVDSIIFAVRTISRILQVMIGFLAAKFMQIWSVDFIKAIVRGLKIAAKKVTQFGSWIVRKMRAWFTGEETGTLADFFDTLKGDISSGAQAQNLEELLGEFKRVTSEERANFSKLREGDTILPQGTLAEPIEAKVIETKSKVNDEMSDISKGIKSLVELSKKEANKRGLDVQALGLQG